MAIAALEMGRFRVVESLSTRMARIDSILSIVVQQGANELQVAAGREPKMLAFGAPKRLTVPRMTEDMLRALLGDILSPEREALVRASGRAEVAYEAGALGPFKVTLTHQDDGTPAATFIRLEHGVAASLATPSALSPSGALPGTSAVVGNSVIGESPSPAHAETLLKPEPTATSTFDALVARAVALGASDVHFAEGEPVFIRIDGRLSPFARDVDMRALLGAAIGELPSSGRSLDVGVDVPRVGRIRIHVYGTERGLAAAVRLLPLSAPSFASLHMPAAFDDVADLRDGLVIVCGATGSGKSTTLAALAQQALRRRSILLVTLEDPIEYALEASNASLVRRRQIGRDAVDFASGLRDALREDPDVILVGEMRDPESIALALTAAETGHLVLTSLHSRSTASAIERIVDTYPPERQRQIRVQLADSLRIVVAQRLLPRARGSGRVPAIEVLRITHATAALIRDGRTPQLANALQSGRADGMLALEHCLADLVASGEVSYEDARAASSHAASFDLYTSKRSGEEK
jgi:twitching motility protein PilT